MTDGLKDEGGGRPVDAVDDREARVQRLASGAAAVAAAVAVLAAARWLRAPRELYLTAVLAATAAAGVAAWGTRSRWARGAAGAFLLAVVAFLVPSGRAHLALRARPAGESADAARAAVAHAAVAALATAARREVGDVRAVADGALADALATGRRADAGEVGVAHGTAGTAPLFDALARRLRTVTPGRGAERAVAVLRGDSLVAWAGTWRVPPDALAAAPGVGVERSAFYLVLHVHARSGPWRAVAATLLHADPPADTLAAPLDRAAARARGLRGFAYRTGAPAAAAGTAGADAADPWLPLGGAVPPAALGVRALVPGTDEARERATDVGRREAAPALLAMTLVWVAAVWRRGPGPRGAAGRRRLLARRLTALLVPVGVIAVAPLNALSNASRAFDATVYFSPVGGPFTGSVGALALTGLVCVVGLFATLRAGVRVPSRPLALAAALALAGGAPFLLRELSRGIKPPLGGTPVWLWVAWQVALFLAAAALLVGAALAGRSVVRGGRGLPPLTAPILAGAAAFAGPLLWTAPAGWPAWYPLLWAVAVTALALTRRSAGLLAAAFAVAGLGSATMVWSATARRRVEFAERDARGLVTADPVAVQLLERLGAALADSAGAGGIAGGAPLLRAYAASDLAPAGYPVTLAVWEAGDTAAAPNPPRPLARVATAQWRVDSAALGRALAEARRGGEPVVRSVDAETGAATVYAAPLPGGRSLAVTLFPRTRVLAEDPVAALLGQPPALTGEAPYSLQLVDRPLVTPARPAADADTLGVAPVIGPARWARSEDEIHGDWVLPLPGGPARAHAEVALRPVEVLAPRGALLALFDLVVAGGLWGLPALADGAFPAARRRWRRAWLGSFRTRITLALFAFFAAPTLAFAVWSYRQIQTGDREQREVLVRETLRAALAEGAGAATPPALASAASRIGTPLLAYAGGVLVAASEPTVVELAPFGRVLPQDAMLRVGVGREVTAADPARVGGREALVGFRTTRAPGGARVVLAAPARTDDVAIGQRRRDLGFLVLLAAVGGGLAALWLSGLAARQLSRPVGALRHAALAIAGGGPSGAAAVADALGLALGGAPPAEFRPVFGAFRQMAGDLEAGREALEAARRRTAAVLRDVASGVLAVDADARVTLANPRAEALLGRALRPGAPIDGRAPAALAERVRAFVARGTESGVGRGPGAGGPGPNGAGPNGVRPSAGGGSGDEAFDVDVGGRHLRARLTRLTGPSADGAAGGAVLTLEDLTELARAQRVLAWGEMARQVAHEIKNPLTPIRLGVQLLRRAHRDARPEFGTMLETTVERVLAEIDRLDEIARSFSRYGTAPDRHAPAEPVDAAAIARDVVALERLGQGGVAWAVEGADAPAPAMARDGELREVLLNLLENARLAGAGRVTVRVGGDAGHVTLAVRDDGEGIPAESLPRIFEPHFSTRTSGSGLGLAISRRLVDAWGGGVRAESVRAGERPGEPSGTTVTLTLRRAPDAPGSADD